MKVDSSSTGDGDFDAGRWSAGDGELDAEWTMAARRISTPLLVELLDGTGHGRVRGKYD